MMRAVQQALANPLIASMVRIGIIGVLAMIALAVTRRFSERVEQKVRVSSDLGPSEGQKRLLALGNAIRYSVNSGVVIIALIMILRETGVDIGPVLVTAGVGGLVIGLGAQNLVRDFFAGIFLLVENHYGIGDWVTLSNVTGKVERVTLRITQMRDIMGNMHIIPNGEIKQVTNLTREWSRAVLDVGVAYKENVDRVMDVLRDVGSEMERDEAWGPDLLEPLEVMGVQDFADSAVVIRIRCKTRPEARWDVMRELRRRIKNRFDAERIEIPFPHRTVYVGQGDAGTLRVGASLQRTSQAEPGVDDVGQGDWCE